MKTKKSSSRNAEKLIGVGIAAIAAATAGAYYLYGSKDSRSNRRTVKSWVLKAKADVMDEIGKMKEVNEDAYKEAIAKVAKKYKQIKGMDQAELSELAGNLLEYWKEIRREIEKAGTATKTKHSTSSRKDSKK
jgi:hypothetical protein